MGEDSAVTFKLLVSQHLSPIAVFPCARQLPPLSRHTSCRQLECSLQAVTLSCTWQRPGQSYVLKREMRILLNQRIILCFCVLILTYFQLIHIKTLQYFQLVSKSLQHRNINFEKSDKFDYPSSMLLHRLHTLYILPWVTPPPSFTVLLSLTYYIYSV